MAKQKFIKRSAFAEAVENKVENIQKEIENKVNNNELQEINIEDIINPKIHDRVGYDEIAIIELATNMKEVGLLQPVILRRLYNNSFERIIGFRRILAAKSLGWNKIKSIVLEDINDDVAALMMLSENLHKEDPNIYDQTVKTIEYLSYCTYKSFEDIKKLLFKLRNYDARKTKEISEEDKDLRDVIENALDKTAKISLSTLVDRLRIFNLDESLVCSIRNNSISYSNAIELNKIKNQGYYKVLFDYVINEKPTKSELIKKIDEYKKSEKQPISVNDNDILVEEILKELKPKKLKKLNQDKYQEVMKYLGQIKKIIEE